MFEKPATSVTSTPGTAYESIVRDNGVAPPQGEVGEIIVEGRQMEKALNALHDEVSYLESRLSLALKPLNQPPNGAGSPAPTPLRSTMAEGLAEANRGIGSAINRLAQLRQRVDL